MPLERYLHMKLSSWISFTRKTIICLFVGALLSLALAANFVHQVAAKERVADDVYGYLKSFTDVLALVQRNYVEEVDFQELVQGAIKGMLLSLDPHSAYLNREIYQELQVETKGQFGGLGIEITVKDGVLTVVAPIEDSPAARAGVQAGDQIIKIADEFAKDMSLVEAVKKMRGPKGTKILIHVHREGRRDLLPVTIVRDIILVKSVRSRMLEEGFGYVRLAQFQEGSSKEFIKAIERLGSQVKDKKLRGLVIDLRNNPGGLLTEAIRVADIFLDGGIIVYTDGRLESQKQKYFAHKDGIEPAYPLVVLINGGSASASEIVAGSLQDDGRALLLGTQTFGKGSVQTILPMYDGSALRLTTALYYTRGGRSIQAEGIQPDIVVAYKEKELEDESSESDDEAFRRRERDLPGAIKNPKKSKRSSGKKKKNQKKGEESSSSRKQDPIRVGSRAAIEAPLEELLKADPQLAEALRLLKTWDIFKGKPTIEARTATS